ncbi:MAG: Ig-like domain-containing protein, partial [archaeon]|nr:Ig-like domain-containing protein [archaeon]
MNFNIKNTIILISLLLILCISLGAVNAADNSDINVTDISVDNSYSVDVDNVNAIEVANYDNEEVSKNSLNKDINNSLASDKSSSISEDITVLKDDSILTGKYIVFKDELGADRKLMESSDGTWWVAKEGLAADPYIDYVQHGILKGCMYIGGTYYIAKIDDKGRFYYNSRKVTTTYSDVSIGAWDNVYGFVGSTVRLYFGGSGFDGVNQYFSTSVGLKVYYGESIYSTNWHLSGRDIEYGAYEGYFDVPVSWVGGAFYELKVYGTSSGGQVFSDAYSYGVINGVMFNPELSMVDSSEGVIINVNFDKCLDFIPFYMKDLFAGEKDNVYDNTSKDYDYIYNYKKAFGGLKWTTVSWDNDYIKLEFNGKNYTSNVINKQATFKIPGLSVDKISELYYVPSNDTSFYSKFINLQGIINNANEGDVIDINDSLIINNKITVNKTLSIKNLNSNSPIYWYGDNGSLSGCNLTGDVYWYGSNGSLSGCNLTGDVYWYGNNSILDKCYFGNNSEIIWYGENRSLINSSKLNKKLNIYSYSANIGSVIDIVAKFDSNINEGFITFYINNQKINEVNVIKGTASCNYNCNGKGNFTVKVVYSGSDLFESSEYIYNFIITESLTNVTVDLISDFVGNEVNFTATVKSKYAVDEGCVAFYVDEVYVGSADVINGVAKLNYLCTNVGNFTVKGVYIGTDYFNNSEGYSNLIIKKHNTTLSFWSNDPYYNHTLNSTSSGAGPANDTINFTVTVKSNSTVNEGCVAFYVDDEYIGSADVINGVAKLNYLSTKRGNFTVKGVYTGTDYYASSEDWFKLRIYNKEPIHIDSIFTTVFNETKFKIVVDYDDTNEGYLELFIDGLHIDNVEVHNGSGWYTYCPKKCGNFTLRAIYYPGWSDWHKVQGYTNLTVEKSGTNLSVLNHTVDVNCKVNFTATVKSNHAVDEGCVAFYVDDEYIGSADVVNGVAKLNYLCTNAGNFTVKAVYKGNNYFKDSEGYSNLIIKKYDTTLSVLNIDTYVNNTVNLTANVKYYRYNENVNEGCVAFYVDDEYIGSADVVNGVAKLNYLSTKQGDFTVKAIYNGTDYFNSSKGYSNLIIKKYRTTLSVLMSTYVNNTFNLTATVKSNHAVDEGCVAFYVDDEYIGSADVVNGVAKLNYLSTKQGDFTVKVIYNGTDYYASSEGCSKLMVFSPQGEYTFGDIQSLINNIENNSEVQLSGHFIGNGKQITINKTLTIDGSGATFDAKNLSHIFSILSDNVILKNINIINSNCTARDGGAVYWSGDYGSLINCSFIGCSAIYEARAMAGAVYWGGVNGSLMNCSFVNCSSRSSDNYLSSFSYGGAVYWGGVNGSLMNC